MAVIQRRRRKEQPQRLIRLSSRSTLTKNLVIAWDGGYNHALRKYAAPTNGKLALSRLGYALLADGTGYVDFGAGVIPATGPVSLMAMTDVDSGSYTNSPSGASPDTGVIMGSADRTELRARFNSGNPYPTFTTSWASGQWVELMLSSSFGVSVTGPGTLRVGGTMGNAVGGVSNQDIYARDPFGVEGRSTTSGNTRAYDLFSMRLGATDSTNRSIRARTTVGWGWTRDLSPFEMRNALRGEHLRAYAPRRRMVSATTPVTFNAAWAACCNVVLSPGITT